MAPAADADDQILDGFSGGGHDRLGAKSVSHGKGQIIGAALVAAEQTHDMAGPDVENDYSWVGRLVPKMRGDGAHYGPAGRHKYDRATLLEKVAGELRDALKAGGRTRPLRRRVHEELSVAEHWRQPAGYLGALRREAHDGRLHPLLPGR